MVVNVLILEDNPVARSFLCRVVRESFSDIGQIIEAGDLEAARQQIALHPWDGGVEPGATRPIQLMLVDLELPDGNGMELLTHTAAYPATKVVTTLYADDDHLFPALQCGADGYLLKEDRFEVLVENLQKIARGQPPLSPAIARRLLSHFRPGAAAELGAAASATSDPLTDREAEVLVSISKGFAAKEIASQLGIAWASVNDHIRCVYRKLNRKGDLTPAAPALDPGPA